MRKGVCSAERHGEKVGWGRGQGGRKVVKFGCAGDAIIVQSIDLTVELGHNNQADALAHHLVDFLARTGEAPIVEAKVVHTVLARGEGAERNEVYNRVPVGIGLEE